MRQDQDYLDVFKNKKEAEGRLRFWIEEYELCTQQSSFARQQNACFHYGIGKCRGACLAEEKCEVYNQRVQVVADSLLYPHENMLIIDKGKKESEKSFIYIKKGIFQGFGYFQLNHQIKPLIKLRPV